MGFLNIFGRKKDSNESKQNSKYDILEKYTKSWLRQASDEELETEREIAPFVKAEDAIVVDTTHLSIEEVVNEILKIIDTFK